MPAFPKPTATETDPVATPAVTAEATARAAADSAHAALTTSAHGGIVASAEKGAANGVATLGADGKILDAQLGQLAITDVFTVASQAAMLALTAERGDVAIRSDLNKSFILSASPASTLANWKELLTPTDVVTSVNGRQGVVTGLAEQTAVTAVEGLVDTKVAVDHAVLASGDTTGVTDRAAINAALTSYSSVALHGDFTVAAPITIPSNRTVLLVDAKITLKSGSQCNIFQNSAQNATGNTNIRIVGVGRAIIDGNAAGNPTFPNVGGKVQYHTGSTILLVNVNGFSLENLQFATSRYSPLFLQMCSNGRVLNTRIDQDNSTTNQGFCECAGSHDILIDGVTGTVYDDVLDCSAFGVSSGTYAGYLATYPLSVAASSRPTYRVTLRNVDVSGYTMLRVLAGDGGTVSEIYAQNIVNRNPNRLGHLLAVGPTSYVVTEPGVNDVIGVTIDGYDGPCQKLIAADSHINTVKVSRVRLVNWNGLLGHQSRASGFYPTVKRVTISDVDASGTAGGDVMSLVSGCTASDIKLAHIFTNACQAILNNGCNVSGLTVNGVRITDLQDNPFKSTGTETGTIDNVSWTGTSGSFTTPWATATSLRMGASMPVFASTDATPAATAGSRAICNATKVLDNRVAVYGDYVADGTSWLRTTYADLFTPLTLTPDLWLTSDTGILDASDVAITADGTAVKTWQDQSGNGRHFAQAATAGKRPLWKTGVANGKPGLLFDGSDDRLLHAGVTVLPSGTGTIFLVFKATTGPTSNAYASLLTQTNTKGMFYSGSSRRVNFYNPSSDHYMSGSYTDNQTGIYGLVCSSGAASFYADGAAAGSSSSATAFTADGFGTDSTGGGPFHGHILEVITYPTALTTLQRQMVTNYLGAKYGVTVS